MPLHYGAGTASADGESRLAQFNWPNLDLHTVIAFPALLYLFVIFLLPLGGLVVQSVIGSDGLDASAYVTFLGEPHHRAALYNTLTFAAWVSFFCLVIGFPFAYVVTRLPNRLQIFILILILLPMASSIVVRTFGWTILLRRDGAINEILLFLGILDQPVRLIFTEAGLILGGVSTLLPLMILPIYSVMRMIPPDLTQCASSLGATPAYTFRCITLPLCMPGIIVGVAFVFAQAASAYVLPLLLAGRRYRTMSTTIVDSYLVLQHDALGAAVSVLLLAIIVSVVVAAGLLGRWWKGVG